MISPPPFSSPGCPLPYFPLCREAIIVCPGAIVQGQWEEASSAKLRLVKKERANIKWDRGGPTWFERAEDGGWKFGGGYWAAREQGRWECCPVIY